MKKTGISALATAAAVSLGCLAAFPAVNADAADEKTAKVELPSDFSASVDFSSLPDEPATKTETVSVTANKVMTLDSSGVENDTYDWVNLSDEANIFQLNDSSSSTASIGKDAIKAAIEAKDSNVGDDFVITGFTVHYSYDVSADVSMFCSAGGFDADGSWIDLNNSSTPQFADLTITSGNGTGTISSPASVTNYTQLTFNCGATMSNSDTASITITGVDFDVKYTEADTAQEEWKDTSGDWDSGYVFDVADDAGRNSMRAELEKIIGANIAYYEIKSVTVDYDYTSSTGYAHISASADGPDKNDTWLSLDNEGLHNWDLDPSVIDDSFKLADQDQDSESGSGTFVVPANKGIEQYCNMHLTIGTGAKYNSAAVSLNVTKLTLEVSYTERSAGVDVPTGAEKKIPYSEIKGNDFINVGFKKPSVEVCGHKDHVSADGVNYTPNAKFCPWAGVEIVRVDANGRELGGTYTVFSATASDTGDIIYSTVSLKDIYAETGSLSAGEYLKLSTAAYVEYTLFEKQPNMQLGTVSISDFVVEEFLDYDPSTGNYDLKTGEPDLRKTEYILNGNGVSKSFEGYDALLLDYTLENPDDCSAVLIVLHGWGDGHVGWEELYFPIDGSGRIAVDLSKYQSLKFYNIYAGVAARTDAKIGDKVTPGFEVTDSALITAYNGTFSTAIPAVEPDDEPVTPVKPSDPTTPANPSNPSYPTGGGSSSTYPTGGGSSSSSSSGSNSNNNSKNDNNTDSKPSQAVSDAKPNTTVSISISTDSTNISSNIFLEAKEKNLTMELKLPNGVTWTIKAGTISDDVKNIDINVDIKTNNIPKDSVNEIAQGNDSMQISLSHNGSFGFNAEVSIPVGSKYNGKYANAYHYNKGIMEFIGSAMVAKGEAPLNLVHASEYAIVFSDEPMAVTEDISSAAGIAEESTAESSANGFIPAAAVIITVFAAVKTVRRIREK